MKRKDLKVGMHVRTGMWGRGGYRGDAYVMALGPYREIKKWHEGSEFVPTSGGSGVAIAVKKRVFGTYGDDSVYYWDPGVTTLQDIAPWDEVIAREDQAQKERDEANQERARLQQEWTSRVESVQQRVISVLGDPSFMLNTQGSPGQMLHMTITELEKLVEKAENKGAIK